MSDTIFVEQGGMRWQVEPHRVTIDTMFNNMLISEGYSDCVAVGLTPVVSEELQEEPADVERLRHRIDVLEKALARCENALGPVLACCRAQVTIPSNKEQEWLENCVEGFKFSCICEQAVMKAQSVMRGEAT